MLFAAQQESFSVAKCYLDNLKGSRFKYLKVDLQTIFQQILVKLCKKNGFSKLKNLI